MCRPSFSRVNPDTIGCVWTGQLDLNTLIVDGEFFESGKKKLRIQKYLDTSRRGLKLYIIIVNDVLTSHL